MPLTYREKELANIGASVATGCKPCTDYHFNKVREAGASDEEIKQAISDALAVRDRAREIMESHGLKHLGIAKENDVRPHDEETTRIKELVSVASAFAVNCTTSVKKHIAAAKTVGITEEEIESVLDAALFIKGEAAHYVGQIVKLREEKDQLQQLLEELERTQAQLVQSEKMAALGKLVAGIVHEINTPIGTINSTANTLSRSITYIVEEMERGKSLDSVKDNRRFRNSVQALRDGSPTTLAASERIFKIVNSLKAFAHLDEAAYQRVDLHDGLDNTLTLLDHDFRDRILVVREYGEIPNVMCNPGEINQVFMNLLQNGAEAIKDKGTITIRTLAKGESVWVQVADTGAGISPRRRQRLFEPAFAKKGSRMKAGLGLFTSANIVQKHEGRIEVESEVGKGSTFTVILPVQGVQRADKADLAQKADRCDELQ
ncbi:MAG: carboxymuconolactone decarboxylase family protein [Candidatus Krumholzibacteria bacterium]|nr:carboxymuconolactone decarboxylase family protein [Candidatus Krumholzibacteria bacterium]